MLIINVAPFVDGHSCGKMGFIPRGMGAISEVGGKRIELCQLRKKHDLSQLE